MKRNKNGIINLALMLLMFGVNALGGMGYINNMSQKAVSDKYMTLITPSPMTFSIWGVIYTLLLIGILLMLFKKEDPYYQDVLNELSDLLRISFVVNTAWIVAFSYEKLLISVVLILILLLVVLIMEQKLLKLQSINRWLLPITLGIYGAWLFVATFVNVAAYLVQINWDRMGLSVSTWTIIILVFAIFVMIFITRIIKNAFFPLTWALYGIYSQIQSTPNISNIISIILIVGIVLSALMSMIQFRSNQWKVIPITYTHF